MRLTAIVLAADRAPDDPLVAKAGVRCKALVPVAGRPMLLRVLDALEASPFVGERIVCGRSDLLLSQNAELSRLVKGNEVRWVEAGATPCTSALAAFSGISPDRPVLLTTADHALLTPGIVEDFCRKALTTGCDAAAALMRADEVISAFPAVRRTVLRMKDGGYCTCNLFAFLTPQGRLAVDFWKRVERERKRPVRVAYSLGIWAVLRYLAGFMTLEEAMLRLSRAMRIRACAVLMEDPRSAVDVDKAADWELAEEILKNKTTHPCR